MSPELQAPVAAQKKGDRFWQEQCPGRGNISYKDLEPGLWGWFVVQCVVREEGGW